MSVLKNGVWRDGFDHYTDWTRKWSGSQAGGSAVIDPAYARFPSSDPLNPSQGLALGGDAFGIYKNLGANLTTSIFGFPVRRISSNVPSADTPIWVGFDSGPTSPVLGLYLKSNQKLQFKSNPTLGFGTAFGDTGTPIGSDSGSFLLLNNAWYFVEVKYVPNTTGGVIQARINGAVVASISGNTLFSANQYISFFGIGSLGATAYYDDLYVLDGTGPAPVNNYLGGDFRIRTYLPSADSATAGLNVGATTPSQTSGNHFNNVKTNPSSSSVYNALASANNRESYRTELTAAPSDGIAAIGVVADLLIDDAGPHTAALTMRNGSTDIVGSTQSVTSTAQLLDDLFPVDPATGSRWAATGYNGGGANSSAESGVKMIS